MVEYIKRDDVMQAFADYVWNSNHSDLVPAPTWNNAVEIVRDIQAADVVNARHGEWVIIDGMPVCSLCGMPVCSLCGMLPEYPTRCCPNCGAKMDL